MVREKEIAILENNKKFNTISIIAFVILGIFSFVCILLMIFEKYIIGMVCLLLAVLIPFILIIVGGIIKVSFQKENKISNQEYLNVVRNKAFIQTNSSGNVASTNRINVSYRIGNILAFDDSTKKIMVLNDSQFNTKIINTVMYDSIVDVELIRDNETLLKGGLGSSLIGGALAGGAGLIAGAVIGKKTNQYCEKLYLKITTNMSTNPCLIINFISTKVRTDSIYYNQRIDDAEKAISKIKVILSNINKTATTNNLSIEKDIPELIRQYKKLLDDGLISVEEYNEKKKKLLNS